MQFTNFALLSLLAFTNALPSAIEAEQDLEALRVSELVARQVPSRPCSHLTNGVHVIAASGKMPVPSRLAPRSVLPLQTRVCEAAIHTLSLRILSNAFLLLIAMRD